MIYIILYNTHIILYTFAQDTRIRHRDDDRERRSIIILKVVQLEYGSDGFRAERADAAITTHNLRT